MARPSAMQPKRFEPPQAWTSRSKQTLRPLTADPSSASSLSSSSQSSAPSLTKPRSRPSVDARPPVLVTTACVVSQQHDGANARPPGDDVPMRGDPTAQGAGYLQGGSAGGRPSAAEAAPVTSRMCGQKASMTKLLGTEDHQHDDAESQALSSLERQVKYVRVSDVCEASEFPPRSSSQSSSERKKKKKHGTTDPALAKEMSCDEHHTEDDEHKAGRDEADEGGDKRMADADGGVGGGGAAPSPPRPVKRHKAQDSAAPARLAQAPHEERAAVTPSPSCASASGTAVPESAAPARGAPRSALRAGALAQHILFFIRHYTQHDAGHFARTQDLHSAFRAALARPNNLIAPGPDIPEYLQRITVVQFGRIMTQLFDSGRQSDPELSFEGVPAFIRPHRKKAERGFKGLLPSII